MSRPDAPIPTSPQSPYPITERNVHIVAGFGRGSAELGIPTANADIKECTHISQLDPGVYFGWVKVVADESKLESETKTRENGVEVEYGYGLGLTKGVDTEVVLPTVLSIGWNPFYGNKEKAVELHIMHSYPKNFYGALVDFTVLGYIRPELNYTTKEALIKDIQTDIDIGLKTLNTPEYEKYKAEIA
ncbi:CYFA0S25e00848g1_1 [Cyberlindnera fabianii]|uniref:Riboflavin kinase n=1 Tax=Cyberlindnera fabianii TaxID=36022 RepID=A0A061BI59_CYBFA|nr:CYFA0S25e00848g1_1 [Cyberlindnera fabianii]